MQIKYSSYALQALLSAMVIIMYGGRWLDLLAVAFVMIVAALIEALQGGRRK